MFEIEKENCLIPSILIQNKNKQILFSKGKEEREKNDIFFTINKNENISSKINLKIFNIKKIKRNLRRR